MAAFRIQRKSCFFLPVKSCILLKNKEVELEFLATGVLLGLTAGFSPGPLFALVIAESIRGTTFDGIKVALSPLITDAPVIFLCYFLLRQMSNLTVLLGIISCLGGSYVFYLAITTLRARPLSASDLPEKRLGSLWKGVLTNAASPHPYLFWASVGVPLMVRAFQTARSCVFLFLFGFYACLIGAKITIAVLTGQSKHFASPRLLTIINRVTGVILLIFSALLLHQGVQYLLES